MVNSFMDSTQKLSFVSVDFRPKGEKKTVYTYKHMLN